MNADLFHQGIAPGSAASQSGVMPPHSKTPEAQFLRNRCECQGRGRPMGWRFVGHYDVVRCECGAWYWALQPKRGGPLVAFPWPGLWAKAESENRESGNR